MPITSSTGDNLHRRLDDIERAVRDMRAALADAGLERIGVLPDDDGAVDADYSNAVDRVTEKIKTGAVRCARSDVTGENKFFVVQGLGVEPLDHDELRVVARMVATGFARIGDYLGPGRAIELA